MPKPPMNRRQFLKTTIIAAGSISTASLLGCGGSSSDSSSTPGSAGATNDPAARFFPQSLASGDPSASSIILWTRVENLEGNSVDLQVSSDASFPSSAIVCATEVTASIEAANDNCLKIKVTGLDEGQTYYYRFLVRNNTDIEQASRLGRFKTAGSSTNEAPVKFSFLSCQDYIGRYYNSLFSLLADNNDDMDFVLHLGDYIYETTGDPSFQSTSGRQVVFSAPEEALTVTQDGSQFLAAQSLSNYRDLYKTYRSDEVLQRVHEKFAFINIWDDHEFSDDSWQDSATYLGLESGEQDTARKQAAAQAFFEFQPVDLDNTGNPLSGTDLGDGAADNSGAGASATATTSVNRNLRFGKHVNLSLADYRTNRPDHLIPEDAFPGEIVMDQTATVTTLMGVQGLTQPQATGFTQATFYKYVDTTATTYPSASGAIPMAMLVGVDPSGTNNGALTQAMIGAYQQAYMAAGIDASTAQMQAFGKVAALLGGNPKLDIVSINATLEGAASSLEAQGGAAQAQALRGAKISDTEADIASLEHGVSYAQMGKQSVASSSLGSRYLVIKSSYELYCAYLSQVVGDTSYDDAWGTEQTTGIFTSMLTTPDATWQILASSVSFTSLLLNGGLLAGAVEQLSPGGSAAIPAELKDNTFYLNVDQWDGFPIRRKVLMGDIPSPLPTNLKAQNTIILSGDIHSSFATDHGADAQGNRAVEFTVAGVSSASFSDLLAVQAGSLLAGNPAAGSLVSALPYLLDSLLIGGNQVEQANGDPQKMKLSKATANGTAVLTATGDELSVTYYHYYYTAQLGELYNVGGIQPMEVNTFTVAKAEGKNSELTGS